MATFPGAPPNPLGFKAELLLNVTWTDITQYVMLRDQVKITNMGRTDESSDISAGQCTLTLKNTDGRFTPKNSSGAYYPNLVRNAQLRISVNATSSSGVAYSGFRFWGEVSSWPPGYDVSQRDVHVQITASGIWRRISQSQIPIGSCYWRYVSLLTGTLIPAAYWAMEDGSGSTAFVLTGGTGTNMVPTGAPSYASDGASFAGCNAIPALNAARMAGNVSSAASPVNNIIQFALSVPAAGDGTAITYASSELVKVATSGTVASISVSVTSASKLVLAGFSSGGAQLFTGTVGTAINGVPVLVSVEFTPSGTTLNWAIRVIKPSAGAVLDQTTGTRASTTIAAVTQVQVNTQGRFSDTTLGQMGVWYALPTLVTAAASLGGQAGELAATRFARICAESGISTTIIGSGGAAMGPQVSATLQNVLQEIEATDGGLLFETTGQFGLGYRTLASMQNQAAAVSLAYTSGALGAVPAPTYDDQLIKNSWTVTSWDGYAALAQCTAGAMSVQPPPNGVGSGYASSKAINANTHAQVNAIAQQLLFQGCSDEVRFPVLTFNFQRALAAPFFSSVPSLRIGDYLSVSSLPSFLGGGTTKQLIWGWTETLGGEVPGWTIEFNTVPEAPFETAFSPGTFSVTQAANAQVATGTAGAVGSTGGNQVSGAQLGVGGISPTALAQATLSARTIGGTTQYISAPTPYSWTFAVTGSPSDATYFICTPVQAANIAAGDTFSNSGGLGGPFTVTSVDQQSATVTWVHFTPTATGVMSTGTVTGSKNGDQWVNTSGGNQLSVWNNGAWTPLAWNAANVITAGTVTATQIAANTITAGQIAAGIVLAGVVDSTTINAATINGSTINTVTINGTNFVLDSQGLKIYDASTTTLRAQVSGQTSNDPFGNHMAVGYVGSVKNWVPNTPGTIDNWNNPTPPSGWSGTLRYKNLAEGNLIIVDIGLANAGASGNVTLFTLPAAYKPVVDRSYPMYITTTATSWPNTLRFTVAASAGTVATSALPSSTTSIGGTFIIALD